MSYQVLARKWRPAILKDLVGQPSVVRILKNSLKENRLHPALIFAGPRGTGKTSTARILAKNLSCPNLKNLTPCNSCKTCQDIDESRSLDVMEIDGASNNGVEAIRQLKETITYLPSGRYKIYIIDEVHMLSISAFNALLKTLEEPPTHAVFIMATTEMRKIPSTILSRCQILQFRQIGDDIIYEQLKKICQAEKAQTEDSTLWILAEAAEGSLRDAQGLLDQMITFCHKKFNAQDVSEILGLTDRSLLLETLKSLLKRKPNDILKILGQLQVKGSEPAGFLQSLIKELRHLLLLKLSPADSLKHLVPLSQEEKTKLSKWAESHSSEDIHLLLDMSLKGSWDIGRTEDSKIFLEMLLLKMSQAPYIEQLFGGIGSPKKEDPPNPVKSSPEKDFKTLHPQKPLKAELAKGMEKTMQTSLKKPDDKNETERNKLEKTNETLLKNPDKKDTAEKNIPEKALLPSPTQSKINLNFGNHSLKPDENQNINIQKHPFIREVQKAFDADILDTKDC